MHSEAFDVRSIERPQSTLLIYYLVSSLALGPFFWAVLLPRIFKYETLRYRFDDEGVSMKWGILFFREIHLTYARIQDIHLRSNVVERWLGLARVEIQTASGSAAAEMVIEGIEQSEQVRDFLYNKMRGNRPSTAAPSAATPTLQPGDDLAASFRELATELRGVRQALERVRGRLDA